MRDYTGDYSEFSDPDLMALCICREAANQSWLGKRGVGWVIQNRATEPGWWGHNLREVILRHVVTPSGKSVYQFSSFNPGDPNSKKFKEDFGHTWSDVQQIVSAILNGRDFDITEGANYYHDRSIGFPATWGHREDYQKTLEAGFLIFYRYAPLLSQPTNVQPTSTGAI